MPVIVAADDLVQSPDVGPEGVDALFQFPGPVRVRGQDRGGVTGQVDQILGTGEHGIEPGQDLPGFGGLVRPGKTCPGPGGVVDPGMDVVPGDCQRPRPGLEGVGVRQRREPINTDPGRARTGSTDICEIRAHGTAHVVRSADVRADRSMAAMDSPQSKCSVGPNDNHGKRALGAPKAHP
ncbi:MULTISPECIES: hypothetical protein [Micrococcaceae]|uniref:hypothetical protein n=1 Tax=Micrococcaceae TaxID=1268 RepID=UPI00117EC344